MKGCVRGAFIWDGLESGVARMRRSAAVLGAVVLVLVVAPGANGAITGLTGGGQAHDNIQPSLGINYIIATQGLFPPYSSQPGAPPLGGIEPYLGEVSLFAGNFAPRGWALCDGQILPINQNQSLYSLLGTTYGGDGRTTFALPDLRGRAPIHEGQGAGLSSRSLGSRFGDERVTLTTAQVPSHNHSLPAPPGTSTGNTGGGQAHPNMQPSLALNYTINLTGLYPSYSSGGGPEQAMGADPYIGEIGIFAGNFAPRGTAFCDGQLLPISQNTALFSILGTTYGGDGRTTVGLPDLRGRTPIGEGSGPGLSPHPLGQRAGVEEVTLTEAQMPSHTHTLPPSTDVTGSTGGSQSHTNVQPFLTLNYIIALWGVYPSHTSDISDISTYDPPLYGMEPFIGEISLFAGHFAPRGWAFCDGQLLAVSQNDALFSLLGTRYGGDGRTTFGLPDLRGRAAVHAGYGPGLSPWHLGQKTGSEYHTLTVAELPSHDHAVADPVIPEPTVTTLCLFGLASLAMGRRRMSRGTRLEL